MTALLLSCACGPPPGDSAAGSSSTADRFHACLGPYLGQEPPGGEARLFAAGLLSTEMNDRDLAISPDLREIIFGVLEAPHNALFFTRQLEDGTWTGPQLLPFSGRYDDVEPHFSPDGSRLYFCSTKPLEHDGEAKDYDIWFVERDGDRWGAPQNPGPPLNSDEHEFYPSVSRDGSIYFTSADMQIMVCPMGEHGLEPRRELPAAINSGRAEYNAFVDPDERFIIFTSHGWEGGAAGRGDLFVSHRVNGEWTAAANLGDSVNSEAADMSPCISPDGEFLFFSSMRRPSGGDGEVVGSYDDVRRQALGPGNGKMDLYWVDTSSMLDRYALDDRVLETTSEGP